MADSNLKQIQFKRTSKQDKAPTTADLARGELALNTNSSNLAIFTKDEADKVVQLAGKGVPFLDTAGPLNVDGVSTFKGNINIDETSKLKFVNKDESGALTKHIEGISGSNDGWYIGSGADGYNAGFMEIGVVDDGNEEIRFAQRDNNNNIRRSGKLLDLNGHTRIPGNLYMDGNATVVKNKAYFGAGGSDIYLRNTAGGANNQLTITDTGALMFQGKPVYWDGRKPTLNELGIENVQNYRSLKQIIITAYTPLTPRYVHIATLTDPGSGSSQLDLMINGGIDSGAPQHYTDYLYLNARSLGNFTTANIAMYIQARRIGDQGNTRTPRYGITVSGNTMRVYAIMPRYASGMFVSVLNISGTASLIETGGDTGADQPTDFINVTTNQVFDSSSVPDVSNNTTGVLPISRGGTGGTSQSAARDNLGLKTAAVRDVGVTTGNVMEVGAFGIGGNGGTSINDITSVKDMMTRLKDTGGTIWRGAVKSGSNVPNSPYAHGSGFFMNAGDTMAAINIDYGSARVRVYAANNTALNADQVKVNELYGTANKPTAADVNAVSKTGDTMSGNLVVNGNVISAFVDTRIVKASGVVGANPDNQGAWISWNRNSGSGATNFMNHRGGGPGGFEWFNGTTGNWTALASLSNTGEFKTISNLYAGNARFGTDGNITGSGMFGGNLNNYLNAMKSDISNSNGNANNRVLKSGDTMTGNLLINANLKVENSQGTMVDFGSETSGNYSRVTLSRKISDDSAKVAMLKITPAGQVQFGIQDTVSAESPTKSMMISNNGFSFDGDTTITESLNVSKTVNVGGNLQANAVTARNNLQVNGQGYFANSIEVQQNISTKLDNSMIILGKDSDLGLVKKNGSSSKLAFANGRTFVVAKSSANRITDPGTETYTDMFTVTGSGDAIVSRNIAVGGVSIQTAPPTATNHLTNKKYVDDTAASTLSSSNSYTDSEITKLSTDSSSKYLPLTGGVLTGALTAPLFSVSAPQGLSPEDLTRKDYVDVLVSNSVGTRVALAGADMTGKLTAPNIESTDQLKSKSLWVTGNSALNGNIEVGNQTKTASLWVTGTTALNGNVEVGNGITAQGGIASKGGAVNVYGPARDNGTTHLWFNNADGSERAVMYSPVGNRRTLNIRVGAGADGKSPTAEWTFEGALQQIIGPGAKMRVFADGNISGTVFGGYITDYINNIANQRVNDIRRGPQQKVSPGEVWNWEVGNGYLTGFENNTSDGNMRFSSWYFRVPQMYRQAHGWTEISNQ